jgi:mannitol PTS system EIIA component
MKLSEILTPQTVELNVDPEDREDAIRRAGALLVQNGNVEDRYIDSMLEREKSVSTFMGNDVAIPHGTENSKQWVTRSGLSVLTVPQGVEYGDGDVARLIIGIAGKGDEHLEILSRIALVCSEEENVEKIVNSKTKEELLSYFEEVEEVG